MGGFFVKTKIYIEMSSKLRSYIIIQSYLQGGTQHSTLIRQIVNATSAKYLGVDVAFSHAAHAYFLMTRDI